MFFNLIERVVNALPYGNTIRSPYKDFNRNGCLDDSNSYSLKNIKIGDSISYTSFAIYINKSIPISNF